MKKFGSVCDFAHERSADLLNAYFSCIRASSYLRMPDIFKSVVEMPASRFWISAPRAAVVVSAMERGDNLARMRPNKREMFLEIFKRYRQLRISCPNLPITHIVRDIVCQPAPKFYISPSTAKILILKARKSWFQEKSKRLPPLSSPR